MAPLLISGGTPGKAGSVVWDQWVVSGETVLPDSNPNSKPVSSSLRNVVHAPTDIFDNLLLCVEHFVGRPRHEV